MKKLIFLIILSFIVIPFSVDAASVTVSLNCPASARVGTNIECKVDVTSDAMVNGLSGNYTFTGLSYVSFAPQNGFVSYVGDSASGFAVGNNSGKTGTFTIGIITLKVDAAGSVQVRNLDASDTSFNSYNAGTRTANIRVVSTNDSLGGLSLVGSTLSPEFSASTYNYTATVDAASVTINTVKGDTYQTVTGGGVKNLNYGVNTFKIVSTSEAGTSKTYTVTITRPDNRNTNNYLKSLTVSPGGINFDRGTTKYNVSVDSNVSSVKITASLDDSKASFGDGAGPRTVNLNYGNNSIVVKAIAENGSVRTYTINVNRKDNRSSNNNLKSLNINNGQIIFNKDTLEYNLSVHNDVTKINVEALAEDSKSIVSINSPELVVGDNVITIDVKSETGEVKTYKINVKRLAEAEKMSDNNNVSSIKVVGYDLGFSKDVYEYELTIDKDDNDLIFEVLLEDENASYVINGNNNLEDGSVITVVVVSESGLRKEYKVNIIKENNNLIYLVIAGIGIVLVVVCGIVVAKLMKKGNKTETQEVNSVSAANTTNTVNTSNAVNTVNTVNTVSASMATNTIGVAVNPEEQVSGSTVTHKDKNELIYEQMKEKAEAVGTIDFVNNDMSEKTESSTNISDTSDTEDVL